MPGHDGQYEILQPVLCVSLSEPFEGFITKTDRRSTIPGALRSDLQLYTIGHSNPRDCGLPRTAAAARRDGGRRRSPAPLHRLRVPQFSQTPWMEPWPTLESPTCSWAENFGHGENPACYRDGKVQFDAWHGSRSLPRVLGRVMQGMQRYRILRGTRAKKTPWLSSGLVGGPQAFRNRRSRSATFTRTAPWRAARPWNRISLPPASSRKADLFTGRGEYLADAYRIRSEQIAYQGEGRRASQQQTEQSSGEKSPVEEGGP